MEKGLPLPSYVIPFLENWLGQSAQDKSTSISAYFSNAPTCTNLTFYIPWLKSGLKLVGAIFVENIFSSV